MWLAEQLRPYGLRPRALRIGDRVAKGYAQEEFAEVFQRYIPRREVEELKAQCKREANEREMREDPSGGFGQ